MKDTFRHKGLRAQLVDTLIKKGIKDSSILDAIGTIPRHFFLDNAFDSWAYKDKAFPIGHDQTISQPYTVARQTELLEIFPKSKILEIGTGSGYQAAILSYLEAKVYSIERQEGLFYKTSALLPSIGFSRVRTLFGDGYLGAPKFAPFDRIIITASCSDLPVELFKQLKIDGIMVLPLASGQYQTMTKIIKTGESSYEKQQFGKYQFVPFLKGVVERQATK